MNRARKVFIVDAAEPMRQILSARLEELSGVQADYFFGKASEFDNLMERAPEQWQLRAMARHREDLYHEKPPGRCDTWCNPYISYQGE
jgi:hypothetical protein